MTKHLNNLIVRDHFDSDMFHIYSQRGNGSHIILTWHICSIHVDTLDGLIGEKAADRIQELNRGESEFIWLNVQVGSDDE